MPRLYNLINQIYEQDLNIDLKRLEGQGKDIYEKNDNMAFSKEVGCTNGVQGCTFDFIEIENCTHTKPIRINSELFNFLISQKIENESISEIILRLCLPNK